MSAFVLNAASFFASAVFIAQTQIRRHGRAPGPRPHGLAALTGWPDFVEGFRYVRRHSHVAALMFVKFGWGIAGGVLLLLTIFGQRVFPVGGSTAAGIGVLYGARGIGAGLGPITLRWMLGQTPAALRRTLGPAYFIVGGFYIALAFAPTLPLAALAVLCAHFGGSILWVFSTVLLQTGSPRPISRPRLRRRARARDAQLVGVELLDRATSSIAPAGRRRTLSFALGVMFMVPGAVWLLILSRWQAPAVEELAGAAGRDVGEEEVLEGRIG